MGLWCCWLNYMGAFLSGFVVVCFCWYVLRRHEAHRCGLKYSRGLDGKYDKACVLPCLFLSLEWSLIYVYMAKDMMAHDGGREEKGNGIDLRREESWDIMNWYPAWQFECPKKSVCFVSAWYDGLIDGWKWVILNKEMGPARDMGRRWAHVRDKRMDIVSESGRWIVM